MIKKNKEVKKTGVNEDGKTSDRFTLNSCLNMSIKVHVMDLQIKS